MQQKLALFWFRRDLRLEDNAGLTAALSSGLPVLPVFILDKKILFDLNKSDARVAFIFHSLHRLHRQLKTFHSTIDVRYGVPLDIISQLIEDYKVHSVFTNHDYEPYAIERDNKIAGFLKQKGVQFHTFKDQVIFEKNDVVKDDGSPYQVYTPYSKKWRSQITKEHTKSYSQNTPSNYFRCEPKKMICPEEIGFDSINDIPEFNPVNNNIIAHYDQTRDNPSLQGTTRAGIHLRFGTISIRQLVKKAFALNDVYLRELIWREFFMQLLWHHPEYAKQACKKEYDRIQWRNNEDEFRRWCEGNTGYPIVDAGMRELNATGFMHNRVRMITASFLVKDLLIDWRWGEAYFAEKLLDFELASNNGNWQWVAGCGCDAAPYFRVFSPEAQTEKFDPEHSYIRKWVPEYKSASYPKPMVDHDSARQRCLAVYKKALGK